MQQFHYGVLLPKNPKKLEDTGKNLCDATVSPNVHQDGVSACATVFFAHQNVILVQRAAINEGLPMTELEIVSIFYD